MNTAVWARDRETAATDMAEGPFTRSSLSGRRVHVDRSGELTEGDSDGLPHTAVAHGLVEAWPLHAVIGDTGWCAFFE